MSVPTTLGARLKYIREKQGLKQNYAAEKVGITQPTLANYERDHRDPDTETLQKLADLYDVKVDWLLSGDNETTSKLDKEYSLDEWVEKLEAGYVVNKNGKPLPEWKIKAIRAIAEED